MNLRPRTKVTFNTSKHRLIPDTKTIAISGERNATLFVIPIPEAFVSSEFTYYLHYQSSNGYKKRSKPLKYSENGEIETFLPLEFSKTGNIKIQLEVISAEQTLKTFESPYMTIKSSILASEEVDSNDLNLLEGAILKFNEVQDKLPYIDDETGTWFVYDLSLGEYVDTGKKAVGSGGSGINFPNYTTLTDRKIRYQVTRDDWKAAIADGYPVCIQFTNTDEGHSMHAQGGGFRDNGPFKGGSWHYNSSPEGVYDPENDWYEWDIPPGGYYDMFFIFLKRFDGPNEYGSFSGMDWKQSIGIYWMLIPPYYKNPLIIQCDADSAQGRVLYADSDEKFRYAIIQGLPDEGLCRYQVMAHSWDGANQTDPNDPYSAVNFMAIDTKPLGFLPTKNNMLIQHYLVKLPLEDTEGRKIHDFYYQNLDTGFRTKFTTDGISSAWRMGGAREGIFVYHPFNETTDLNCFIADYHGIYRNLLGYEKSKLCCMQDFSWEFHRPTTSVLSVGYNIFTEAELRIYNEFYFIIKDAKYDTGGFGTFGIVIPNLFYGTIPGALTTEEHTIVIHGKRIGRHWELEYKSTQTDNDDYEKYRLLAIVPTTDYHETITRIEVFTSPTAFSYSGYALYGN